jgi:hypothetical protein
VLRRHEEDDGRVTAASTVQMMLNVEVTASLIAFKQLIRTVRLYDLLARWLVKEMKLVAKLRWRKD